MKPLPKWVGAIGALGTIYSTLEQAGVFSLLQAYPTTKLVVGAVGAVLAYFAHSATGTGGK